MSGGIDIVVGITMLKASPGHEVEAYNDLKGLKNVKDLYRLSGEYDLLMVLKAEDKENLYHLINEIKDKPIVTGVSFILVSKDNDSFREKSSHK